ncbi:MAG: AMP-binding protein, partial [Micromonosporaceae bacterium]
MPLVEGAVPLVEGAVPLVAPTSHLGGRSAGAVKRRSRAPSPAVVSHSLPASARRLHHVFEAACDRDPTAVALECGDEQLTYRELDGRANQLGRHIRGLGIGNGKRVAILLQRSVQT